MLILLFFFVIFLGLIFYKSRFVRLLQYGLIYIVFVFNNWNKDYVVYRKIYEGYYGFSHESGFTLLCQFFYNKGVSYEVFKFYFVSVAIILLLIAFHILFRQSSNRAYSLILLYPLLPLVAALRNFMAIAILACMISLYFSKKMERVKEKIILILVILLGASFHYSVLLFLILLLPRKIKPEKTTYLKILLLSLASIVICNIPLFRIVLAILFNSEKVLNWFVSSNRIGLGIIVVFLFHIVSFWIYDYIYRIYYSRKFDSVEYTESFNLISNRIYSLNVFSFSLFGLYTYNMEFFSRVYIFVLLLNCFHVSSIVKKTNILLFLRVYQLLYHIAMFVYFCQPFNSDGIMAVILGNNLLFP